MFTIIVRLNEEEQKAFNEYAKLREVSLSTLFKQSLKDKMEDEMDLKRIKEYEADLENGDTETYSHDAIMKTFGLLDEI